MRLLLCLALLAPVAPAVAQGTGALGTGAPTLSRAPIAHPAGDVGALLTTPAGAFTASLVVPGAGQAALGLHRWVLYGAAEVAFWAVRLEADSDRRRYTRAYRDLAWEEARLQRDGPRQDGHWGYYETMSHYLQSGAFDRDPALPEVQPEEDPSTYNGAVWALARSLYLPGGMGGPGAPGYEKAVGYYEERAAGPAFLWSWEGNLDALDRFRGLIGEADDAARSATTALGLVLANHLVSAVDALIVARLRADGDVRLESWTESADPLRWSVGLHISLQD